MIMPLEDYAFPKFFWCASNNWFLREETIGGVVNDKWFELFNDYFFHWFNVLQRPPDAPSTYKGPNQKVPVLSTATLNLADFASIAGDKQEGIEIFIPLEVSVGSFKSCLSLCLVLNLVELRNTHEASETFSKFIMSAPVSPNPGKALLTDKNGGGFLKAGLRKVKFLKALSFRRHKKAYHAEEGSSSDGRNSVRSEDPNYVYPVDTDSLDEDSEGESEEGKEYKSVQKSFSYEALVYANHAGGSFCSNTSGSSSDEDLVHYSHHISDTRHKYPEDTTAANQSAEQSSKRSLIS
ncbi:uncharacterized protein LOC107879340 [Capsicum annuum]|uniref:uncharacterized protein LOC107879340 n=1 Tax=Capsicum annuum TaxID=4072 RepID=UPI001FB14199|nr:uncharacterized protein LOC107879340 [Capsicum annuum]